jgi:HK97 gp10 family phage protein
VDCKISGVKEIDDKLQTLGKTIARKVLRHGMRAGAKPVAETARRIAPVKSGLTKQAIKVKAIRKSRKTFGVAVQVGEGNYVGKTFYAAFVEFGHKTGKRGSTNRKWVEGQHFMERAYNSTADMAKTIAMSDIKDGIDKEVRKLGATI